MSAEIIRLFEVAKTDKAYLFSTTPKSGRDGKQVWVPKSIIEHLHREPPVVGEWKECHVRLPLWFCEKEKL